MAHLADIAPTVPAVDRATNGHLPAIVDQARTHPDVDTKNVTVSIQTAELNDGTLVIWWPVSGSDHHIEAAYDSDLITLTVAKRRLRTDLARRGLNIAEFFNKDAETAVSPEVARALAQLVADTQAARDAGLWDANYQRMTDELGRMFRETNSVLPVLEVCFQAVLNELAKKHELTLTRAVKDADDQLDGKILFWRDAQIVILPHGMTAADALDQLRAAVDEA